DFGWQLERARDTIDRVLDYEHSLRSAESAECGLRRLVREAHGAGRFDIGEVVRVIDVEERSPRDRVGEIEAPAGVAEEGGGEREQAALIIEAHFVARQEWMALARERHIEHARQAHAYGQPRLPRADRGDGGVWVRLHFLAAERAAHAETFDRDLI